MGIFSGSDKQSLSYQKTTTIISEGVKIEGTLNCAAKLHIDGYMQGEIFSSNVVMISNTGKFYGNIQAKKLILNGFLEGKVQCDSVELLGGCTMKGDVEAEELMVEAQAIFNGQSIMKRNRDAKKEEQ